jgi:ABC-type bacteriocin/lantibiotic exporter with double-glycine peptidase domain
VSYTLNPIFVLRNANFRKMVFFNKAKLLWILILSMISICIYNSFPLVTQIYIRYLYNQDNLGTLINVTIGLIIIFIFKLIIDIIVEKYLNAFFLKLERNIKKIMFSKYATNIQKLIRERSSLFTTHIYLYSTLIKTMYYNLLDIIKIFFIMTVIYFFDRSLFRYALYAVPFFILFYLIGRKARIGEEEILEKKKEKRENADFGLFLSNVANSGMKTKEAEARVDKYLEERFERKSKDKNNHVNLNASMNSFVGFFRIVYLGYFGYYIITFGIHLSGLIIGLLYITLLIKPCIRLLQSIPFYTICSKSFFKINALCQN